MDRGLQRLLLVLGFAVAVTALVPQREDVSYEEAISSAVHLYNQEVGLEFTFRLLEAKNQLEWDSKKEAPQNLEFTMKETICPSSEQVNPEECAFKEDGVIKECSGTFARQQAVSTIQLNCEEVAKEKSQEKRVKRGAIGKFIRKIKKKFRIPPGGGSLIAQGGKRPHGTIA